MRVSKDVCLDLMTLPELTSERDTIYPKIIANTATVREVRRFAMLHSLIMMFEQAKRAHPQKKGMNIGQQVKQDLIQAQKRAAHAARIGTPVLHNGLNGFQSEDINDI